MSLLLCLTAAAHVFAQDASYARRVQNGSLTPEEIAAVYATGNHADMIPTCLRWKQQWEQAAAPPLGDYCNSSDENVFMNNMCARNHNFTHMKKKRNEQSLTGYIATVADRLRASGRAVRHRAP